MTVSPQKLKIADKPDTLEPVLSTRNKDPAKQKNNPQKIKVKQSPKFITNFTL